jgi:hypothetical protein
MKITDFPVVYICPDHNPKYHARKLHMDKLLKDLGFKEIEHYKSGTEGYPECLNLATIAILEKYIDRPVLLVEDDIEVFHFPTTEIDVLADAIYLGLSTYAGSRTINLHDGNSKFQPHNKTYARVMNMLSAHAVLYISQGYKQALISSLKSHIGMNYYNDVLASRLQSEFNVLAFKNPVFYQSNKFNTNDIEIDTKFCLE